jgi:hypothetical protein
MRSWLPSGRAGARSGGPGAGGVVGSDGGSMSSGISGVASMGGPLSVLESEELVVLSVVLSVKSV